ncbi:MAG: LuxR C-terminal-related transcriptional regulator [Brevibacterium sp.]|nr:LuxR C-terminal-related transcriptional regulator [Brevibacterium sp.]MDN6156739.1 LuxR C-terminal-related transcriptional regulator [Brevibacterium sp.]MDN6176461.1 LuxR C-terminal-related transcriptional regulator [Brevibacterium sp.]MDN6189984.1 LuxR C-terminal-related transcriptional regulator [Brevibacterium sp.]MDN6191602.1 LuxR C-terminal-related transcriptional regulator [Brevibacterium sp.]
MKSDTHPLQAIPASTDGSQTEIAQITHALADPNVQGALVIGASGMGKTTTINGVAANLGPDASVFRFRGSNLIASRDLGIFEVLLSYEGEQPHQIAPGAALSIVTRIFERENAPVVIIDNADRVDDHSLSIVSQLAASGRIKFVAAAETIRHPVDLLAALWTAGKVMRTDLEGLDEAAIAAIARESGYELDYRTIADYRQRSKGNPRMLRKLIVGRATSIVSRRGADHRALWNVLPAQNRILKLIAMAGALPYEALRSMCEPELLDDLSERGIISITRGRRAEVSVVEPAVAQILRDSVQPTQSLQLLREITPILEGTPLVGAALFGQVRWAQDWGVPVDAVKVLGAAMWANSRGDFAAAIGLLRDSNSEDSEIHLELARAERGRGDAVEAELIVDRLISSPQVSEGSDRYLSRLACLELRLTDPREPHTLRTNWVRDQLQSAVDTGRLDVTRAQFEVRGGRLDEGRKLSERVFRDRGCLPRHRQRACSLLGHVEIMCGRIERGLEYLSQAEAMFSLPDTTSFEVEDSVPQIFTGRYLAGDWERARTTLKRLTPLEADSPSVTSLVDLWTGHITRAQQTLDKALTNSLERGDHRELMQAALHLAEALLQMRETSTRRSSTTAASDSIVRFHRSEREGHSSAIGVTKPICGVPRADYDWCMGYLADLLELEARALTSPANVADDLYRLGTEAAERGAHTLAVYAWMEASRHDSSAAKPSLLVAAEKVDGDLGRLASAVAKACLGDDEAVIDAADEALSFGAVVMCADLSRSARDRAVQNGDSATVKHARMLLDSSLRAITFEAGGVDSSTILTAMEKQLVTGVAEGASNSELGARLHLSVRTVEWHLGRLYRRLHVSDRQELKQFARRLT